MYWKLTNTLAKIIVAEQKKRSIVIIFINNSCLNLLNLLWKAGYIYGYTNGSSTVIIYLKYYQNGIGLFSNLLFLGKINISFSKVKKLSNIHKNEFYLLLVSNGFLSIKDTIKERTGGYLISRL